MGPRSTEDCHRQIEAMKLGYADGLRYIADPRCMEVSPAELLDEGYLAKRRALICDTALEPSRATPRSGGTVYLCAADGEGNMVSWIQSNYMDFGSGIVVPGTASPCTTEAATSASTPPRPTAWPPASGPITR